MPTPFSSQDLSRIFDTRALTRGRTLVLTGAVQVRLDGDAIAGVVEDRAGRNVVRITPSLLGNRVVFDHSCTCGTPGCPHLAAAGFAALDRFPALRRTEQKSFLDALVSAPEKEPQRTVFELSPGTELDACIVSTLLVGELSGAITNTTPHRIAADERANEAARSLARTLGGGNETRIGVSAAQAGTVLEALVRSGLARWHAGGKRLLQGEQSIVAAVSTATLPPRSGIIVTGAGPVYVNAETGAVGPMRVQAPAAPPRPTPAPPQPARPVGVGRPESTRRRIEPPEASTPVIVERAMAPVLRLTRFPCPDDFGRMQDMDALLLTFDYEGATVAPEDDRQFIRVEEPSGPLFIRRSRAEEARVQDVLRQEGFLQMRIARGRDAKGQLVFAFRGRDAAASWERFVAERLPILQGGGWRSLVDPEFGLRMAGPVGECDVRIADAPHGGFALDFGIEVDGVRVPLLPILRRLRDGGGLAAARRMDGNVVTSLDDGRIVKLPAERIERLLGVMDDLIEGARRNTGEALVLEAAEAPAALELEGVVTARWQDGSAIAAQVARFRGATDFPEVAVPSGFRGHLRPYQQQGVNWLQHLRENGLGGLLADDMGLGKTAQTIAHMVVEHAAGRLDRPALVVVPTSLVSNWVAELSHFAPALGVVVLHGLDRHERRRDLHGVHVVITTYTLLVRDIEAMVDVPWHMVVLDESQAIKSSGSKATHAVCRLDAGQRVCLSGTPIENHLGELWSQFVFLMPGLLGPRKVFNKRFRIPIEKEGDVVRRRQLGVRISPFILRRTKTAVAPELPPKHTVLRRITLAPEQRELYETIRATMHARVMEEIAGQTLARSHMVVLDALLKLRQVCCDPGLMKVASALQITESSKLDELMEMVGEMISEGRRILVFSQFTSMLDLMKPRLHAADIPFVELRGDTRDRETPVRRFEAGEVPLFLISLKAGGRGLNLVAADTVIHYDPWWNPAVEDQASDRAHRIGQTKSVFIYKLIAADTVEERILELQERKAALASIAFGEDAGVLSELDEGDIEFLFRPAHGRLAA